MQVEKLIPTVKAIIVNNKPVIIASDLVRTKETAKILFGDTNVVYEESLRECNNGNFKNMKVKEFLNLKPTPYFSKLNYDEKYSEGESPHDFYNRVKKAIE